MRRGHQKRKRPRFRKIYKFYVRSEEILQKEKILQEIHSELAERIFPKPGFVVGDWTIKAFGVVLYVDPVLGSQAELEGTAALPFLQRLIIHARLLNLIKNGYTTTKAVKICLTLTKQLKSSMNLRNWRLRRTKRAM